MTDEPTQPEPAETSPSPERPARPAPRPFIQLIARDVMHAEVFTVTPDMDNRAVARELVERGISGAPVVDASGELIGVISITDFVRASLRVPDDVETKAKKKDDSYSPIFRGFPVGETEPGVVREIMSEDVITAPASLPLPQLAALMVEKHVHRVIITSSRRVVGIASTVDLLRPLVDRGIIGDAKPRGVDEVSDD